MNDTLRSTRIAQDTMVLLWAALAGFLLVLAGGMLPVPMVGCLGLPLAILAGLGFSMAVLACGRLEVPWWRQTVGVLVALGGLALFFHSYLDGLFVIAAHFLGREGAPPLSALWRPGGTLGIAALAIGGAAMLRRRGDRWVACVLSALVGLTSVLAWSFLIVLALLGIPLGA